MENLNIDESQRANANGNNLSPEELLDCCLNGKMLTNKPVRFKAMRDWLSTLWEPSQNASINNNWKHSLFGRVKVVCDPKTKKMSFLMVKTDAEISARTSETQWVPIIFNDQDKQAAEGSNNNSVPRKQNNSMIIVENVRAVQEIRDNGKSFFSKAPVLLEPTGPVSYMPIQTRNRQLQGNTNNQLSILPAEITNPGTQTEGKSSQMAKNEGTGGIPKKRLRLEGGLEDKYEAEGTLVTQKLNNCATSLTKWSAANCQQTWKEIEKYRRKLEVVRAHVDATNLHYYNALSQRLDFLLVKDDMFWRQRAKTFWYREGDLNTRYFHATATTRKNKNRIVRLEDVHGNVCNSVEDIKGIAKDYFMNLFQQQNGERMPVINAVTSNISAEDNNDLTAPFSIDEFKDVVFSMEADKCPGPDGFNPGFYHNFWDLCGNEIFEAGCSWLECGAFPPSLNSTNIALIPKGDSQASMKDWRPISLCNVLYKIVAKVLANRLKPILEKCISENQSAFIPGRSILDNAMAAIEIIHYMKSKTKGKKGEVALKLDISKAYDRIDWEYLKDIMAKMGFSQQWIGWIMLCVETVDYSIIVNGNMVGPVVPGRGLRQGDPLSPYLFIICAEGLSALIRQAENRGDLHATVHEAIVLKNILSVYEAASGQTINLQKSEFYCSRNVHADLREEIAHQLGVTQVLGTGKYLGLPSMIGRSKKSTFKFIKDRIWKKINSWSSRHLSQAGREVMIKSILQSIPTYVMSIFLRPKTLLDDIEKMLNSFWWGHSGNNGRGLHWLSWERLSVSKDYGGMGFKNLQAFNMAMLGKQAWNLITRPSNLVTKLLKAKYFPNCDFFESSIGHNPSYVWRSIWSSKSLVKGGCRWTIGTGEHINIWEQHWLKEGMPLTTPYDMQRFGDITKVKDLMLINSKTWDFDKIRGIFDNITLRRIMQTPLYAFVRDDKLVWKLEQDGVYSVRSAYKQCVNDAGYQDRHGVAGQWNNIWHAKIPPKVKNLIWRIGRDVLPTRKKLNSRGVQCPMHCVVCNDGDEYSTHILFSCTSSVLAASRNNKVWEDVTDSDQTVVERAKHLITSWRSAQQIRQSAHITQPSPQQTVWTKPKHGRYKCNVDASFSLDRNKVGIGMCLRDDHGRNILASNLVNSDVKFIRRQANEVAHRLAGAATSLASFHNFITIPSCIYNIIINEMR
ncbi:unnamed protein product [Trifolium pratense]|uniref:Uncharacterized protein n=1 Tax=Trifolium pratense TaxID=57577 RepID=A0ACB0ITY0_TRIPR|nr:unnamed protein product [Trifolium pratense]